MKRPTFDKAVFLDHAEPVQVQVGDTTCDGILLAENDGQRYLRWIADGVVQVGWMPAKKVRRAVTT